MSILPCTLKWELHRGIVPPEEDYFDYSLVQAALCPISRQYLTLTREDVGTFQFSDFKVHAKHKSFVCDVESLSVYKLKPSRDQ